MSKCTSILHNGYKLNVVDTPGHADFGGEVERIMDMVDGVCLVVCATEGPMAQTKFVLEKALRKGCMPIVVINKVDRATARVKDVEDEIFDLFCNLNPTDAQLDYPTIYASARDGWAVKSLEDERQGVKCLLDTIVTRVPHPNLKSSSLEDKVEMLISQTESSQFFGRLLIGKINSGALRIGDKVHSVNQDGESSDQGKILKIIKKLGMGEVELEEAHAGDIVSISGLNKATVSHTVNTPGVFQAIKSIPINPPMLSMTLTYNDSPFAGNDGTKTTINQIVERLVKEAEDDVSLKVDFDVDGNSDKIKIKGRGDLHLGILIEKMRREGFEISISPPEVLTRRNEQGIEEEPIELVSIETELDHVGQIIEVMNNRKGILLSCEDTTDGKQRLNFDVPTRGMIGFRTYLTSLSKGQAILNAEFDRYDEFRGEVKKTLKGAIISTAQGPTTAFALKDVETKGQLFVGVQTPVYAGQVIGEHVLEADMEMNPTKVKPTTNVRTHEKDDMIRLLPPRMFNVEEAIAYMRSDELVEVTPKWI